jgi:hypothetical protein
VGGGQRREEGWGVGKGGTRYLEVGVELVAICVCVRERGRVERDRAE